MNFGGTVRTKMESFVQEMKSRTLYFVEYSSLRGVGDVISLARTQVVTRLFWLSTLTACVIGSASVLSSILQLYTEDLVSYSVETDYLHWDTAFPAVTVCEALNENKLKADLNNKKIPPSLFAFAKDVSFWNNKYCKSCPECELNISCVEDFMMLLTVARATCEELFITCWFDDKEFSCCERFKPLVTEYGTCFVFNSEWTGDGNITVNRRRRLPTLKILVNFNILIRIHSPAEMVSVALENILGAASSVLRGTNIEVVLQAEEIKSDRAVQSIPRSSRDCLFKDEPPALDRWPFPVYSYGACLWYCRAMENIRLCNCTYHFMPKIDQVPVCNIEGLRCLNILKDLMDYNVATCPCPLTCDEVSYKLIHLYPVQRGSKDCKVTEGSVKIGQFPNMRVRRRVVRDILALVVDIGGVVGVFFGASILSFIEIIYIFCLRKYQ